jgi:hypothetical protein
MAQQAKVLQAKKLARMATVAKQLRPKVSNGIVSFNQSQAPVNTQQFATRPPAVGNTARSVVPQSGKVQTFQQTRPLQPQKVVKTQTGCSSCKRKIGG